ncbi:MAG TPA: hypothetical protein VK789_13620 [Bryobacteraceae bacterium]|nr:hypothetical protein [Bryobacteraceae bacterium]
MTCPRCHSELEGEWNMCPECGVSLMRNISGVMKTSAVLIAAGGEPEFYSSVKDVPEPLRTQLLATTASSNSGTIVIADRAGKEQLTQAMARREAARTSVPESVAIAPDAEPTRRFLRKPWLAWAGFALVLVLAAVIAVFFYFHW